MITQKITGDHLLLYTRSFEQNIFTIKKITGTDQFTYMTDHWMPIKIGGLCPRNTTYVVMREFM